jgi:stage II sporulation protein D
VRILFAIYFLFASFSYAQQLRIGVYRDYDLQRIMCAYNDGSYSVFADSLNSGAILPNEFVEMSIQEGKVLLKKGALELGVFDRIILQQNDPNNSLVIASKSPSLKQRKYVGDFEITCAGKELTVVNLVELNDYLEGVVESEGGGGAHLEYYKVQALISRTYALKHIGRHAKEGFDLCDRVHCQAYHNMLRYSSLIDTAVRQTTGLVIVDAQGAMIESYFHANCGGQTFEPQYVWNEEIPYLNSFIDTFCIYTKQASWEKRINKKKWSDFLESKYNYPVYDSVFVAMMFTFDQPQRKAFYIHPSLGIPLRDLREEFGLKSTFFSCYPEGDEVVLRGRGFGHGVGLCQEGAMKMARSGYSFDQIIKYYFPGSKVYNDQDRIFFKQSSDRF